MSKLLVCEPKMGQMQSLLCNVSSQMTYSLINEELQQCSGSLILMSSLQSFHVGMRARWK